MDPGPTEPLSPTELAVLSQLATGATNREIARARGISEATVKKHLTNINTKLGTGNRTEAMRRALELGLVEVETPGGGGESGDPDAARLLAAELERMRQRARRLVRWWFAAALIALAVAVVAVVWRPDPGPDVVPTPVPVGDVFRWDPAAPLPSPRSGLAAAVIEGGLYVVGGADAQGPLSETLRYDRGRLEWGPMAEKPTAVTNIAAEAILGRIVVPGGCTAGEPVAVVEAYDPALDVWSTLAPLPEPRCGYALAAHDGRLFLFGGRSGTDAATASDVVWRYDPAGDSWTSDESMPLPRSDLVAVRMGDRDEIHLLGGRNRDGAPMTDHWVFRPNADDEPWDLELAAGFDEPRAGLAAAAALDRLYVVGGGGDETRDSVFWDRLRAPGDWRYDKAHFPDPGPPIPQRGAAMVRIEARKLALVGGEALDGRLLDQHHTIDLAPFQIIIPGGG